MKRDDGAQDGFPVVPGPVTNYHRSRLVEVIGGCDVQGRGSGCLYRMLVAIGLAVCWQGCVGSEAATSACVPGDTQPCICPPSAPGAQTCAQEGMEDMGGP